MDQKLYLQYGVYTPTEKDQKPMLVYATDAKGASRAWQESDEAYADISGGNFSGIFADDAKSSHVQKWKVRRLSSDEEYQQLLKEANPYFTIVIEAREQAHSVGTEYGKYIVKQEDGSYRIYYSVHLFSPWVFGNKEKSEELKKTIFFDDDKYESATKEDVNKMIDSFNYHKEEDPDGFNERYRVYAKEELETKGSFNIIYDFSLN